MNTEAVREWLLRAPFEPFLIKLSNGDTYEVRHPELLALGKNRAAVYNPENDMFDFVSLLHINNIEMLRSSGQTEAR